MTEQTGDVIAAAIALMTRKDFWDPLEEIEVLPAEYDSVVEALDEYDPKWRGVPE